MTVWKENFIPINVYSRPGYKLKAKKKGILHYTANPGATAKNHPTYFGKTLIEQNNRLPVNKRRYASAHIFVDKVEALCLIPLDELAYAANDGTFRGVPVLKPNANYLSISVEMCQEKDGSLHPTTIERTEDVFVELCKLFNWDPLKDIVRHYDVTHKNCPAPWVKSPQEFIAFKNRVKEKMGVRTAASKVMEGGGDMLNPSNPALSKAVQGVLAEWEKDEKQPLSPEWRKKFEKRELSTSDAIGLLFVGIQRGYIK